MLNNFDLKPVRLAVIFDQEIRSGGGYQQSLNALKIIQKLPREIVEPVYFTTIEENTSALSFYGVNAQYIFVSSYEKIYARFRRVTVNLIFNKLVRSVKKYTKFEECLIEEKIDLVYFTSPSRFAYDLYELNFILTIWDLCHRDDPEFPEVRWNNELESREHYNNHLLPKATAIIVDSELGKNNLSFRYRIDKNKILVSPFQAAITIRESQKTVTTECQDIRKKYNLEVPYIIYPAQFWPHKNHTYLLKGLKMLEEKFNLKVGAILCGSDKGNMEYVKSTVINLGLKDRIRFAGFVDNEEMPELYKQSLALVMPTYFGPTNLPPLEAFTLGIPVLYSNKAGLRDQVGDAALLMDLTDPVSMAKHLKNLIDDEDLRNKLVHLGYVRLEQIQSSDFSYVLCKQLEEFKWRRFCWR